ncbi:flagellar hook-basal body complex protein [Xinfangfangia sp. CPCC 101601]|uniref:Flagellar basal-body rod protein FlgF n=1 Tax=Pseudogemmobacter lacusdianii TaxID=3069608 RepID=A0ABU0VUB5_9RHOB|nr:flagellar hook-basal body complex protein [Xinfangfangia sp. CPCC 101601]MDQ2065298.1 flagellar hook-basal body complex protein [Xinfangfangia sp. CPCC 101601]
MDAAGYTTLSRQSGLMREMQIVANNVANIATSGFRREGTVFAEHVFYLQSEPSLSVPHATGRVVDLTQAAITQTGGAYDFAIQGDGFFLIETPQGNQLTRAGSFTPNEAGELVTPDGHRLLDAGGAPIFVPAGAGPVAMARDGSISVQGQPLAQAGLWQPVDPLTLRHQSGTMFSADEIETVENPTILQGFLEESNVNPISEIARMIEVQRAYEQGQRFLEAEDARMRGVIETLGR